MFSLSKPGVVSRLLAAGVSRLLLAAALRFLRRDLSLGSELVMELLVADMNELLAALRNGVGNALRIRCEVGMAFVGGDVDAPKVFIWDGGIHGAKRCMRPRICWGILSAVAKA